MTNLRFSAAFFLLFFGFQLGTGQTRYLNKIFKVATKTYTYSDTL